MPTADELYQEANCFLCYGITQTQALKIALLRLQVLELDPNANVSPEALLASAACYNCYANGSVGDLLELALLAIIAATPCTPGNVDGLIWGPNPETVDSIDDGLTNRLTDFTDAFFPTSAYTEFSLGNPTTVTNSVDFDTNTVITSITFRLLETIGADLNFNNNGALVSFSAPLLQSIGNDLTFASTAALTSFSAPLLQTVGNDMNFSQAAVLTNLTLPSLVSVSSQISVDSGAIEVLSLPVLSTYPPAGINADGSLLTLNLPACVDDGAGQLNTDLGAMAGLVTLNLASVVTITANLTLSGSPNLASFTASAWIPTDGTVITFNGCSLNVTSVELILRRLVLAGVVACTIDLSGGTNAGTASLSAQGQADVATLGAQVTMNP